MTYGEFKEALNSLPVRQLVTTMRFLNDNKPLGYDYMKKSKAELQANAVSLMERYATLHSGEVASYQGIWSLIQDALTNDERVKASETQATVTDTPDQGEDKGLELVEQPYSGGDSGNGGLGGGGDNSKNGKKTDGGKDGKGEGSAPGDNNGAEGNGAGEGEGEGEGDGKQPGAKDGDPGDQGEQGKGKAPSTLAEMLVAEVMKNMPKPKAPNIDQKTLEKLIQKEMEKRANTFRIEVKSDDPLVPDLKTPEKPRHAIFKEVLAAVSAGENVLLVGPAGCGKTYMAGEIAKVLGYPFRFTGAVASEYKLLGFINAQGALVRTEYREAYENGGVFLWDEMDASAAQAMLSFNAGLANGHQDFPDTIVPRHKTFRAIASANTYGHGADRQYVGRNQMDAASLDRFYVVPMDYDEELEKSLFGNIEWVRYVQNARRAVRKLGIRHVVSMRAIESGLRMIKTGMDRKDIERGAVWKHLTKEEVAKVKNEMFKAAGGI